MKILHTSDWHIGRTFHGHSTVENLRVALHSLVQAVRDHDVDVVVVSGDIFDSATPAAEYYTLLTSVLRDLRAAGAAVVMTSGNHDSATRLGFQSEFASLSGVHVITNQAQHDQPVTIDDEHGPVHFYGIPYLEPSLVRHHYPEQILKNHEQVLGFVMDRIRTDLAVRGGRSVVLSHCFAVGIEPSDVERDITSGGIDYVPVGVFDGPDYVALGHIHARSKITDRVRYSGAPLHYSFGEVGRPRGAWLIEFDANGLRVPDTGASSENIEWIDLPVPRAIRVLTGTLDELLTDAAFDDAVDHWVSAVLTDQSRPLDGMRRLQLRFPWCVKLTHRPATRAEESGDSYTGRVAGKGDHEIIADFLGFVRNGVGPSAFEKHLIADVLAEGAATEVDGDAVGAGIRSTSSAIDPRDRADDGSASSVGAVGTVGAVGAVGAAGAAGAAGAVGAVGAVETVGAAKKEHSEHEQEQREQEHAA